MQLVCIYDGNHYNKSKQPTLIFWVEITGLDISVVAARKFNNKNKYLKFYVVCCVVFCIHSTVASVNCKIFSFFNKCFYYYFLYPFSSLRRYHRGKTRELRKISVLLYVVHIYIYIVAFDVTNKSTVTVNKL